MTRILSAHLGYLRRPGPYVYKGVPPEVYAGLEQADRKGPYVNGLIKQYPYEHLGRWPKTERVGARWYFTPSPVAGCKSVRGAR